MVVHFPGEEKENLSIRWAKKYSSETAHSHANYERKRVEKKIHCEERN